MHTLEFDVFESSCICFLYFFFVYGVSVLQVMGKRGTIVVFLFVKKARWKAHFLYFYSTLCLSFSIVHFLIVKIGEWISVAVYIDDENLV